MPFSPMLPEYFKFEFKKIHVLCTGTPQQVELHAGKLCPCNPRTGLLGLSMLQISDFNCKKDGTIAWVIPRASQPAVKNQSNSKCDLKNFPTIFLFEF